MSHFIEYQDSIVLVKLAYTQCRGNVFYTALFAAMREADTDNLALLQEAFPEEVKELQARYNAPGGILFTDRL